MWTEVVSRLSSSDLVAVLIIGLVAVAATLILVTYTIASHWAKVQQLELEAALKEEMLSRGLSVEEITQLVKVTNTGSSKEEAPEVSAEVVVERDGQWVPGIILESKEDRCLVHFTGHDASDNQWVTLNRIRFRDKLGAPIDTSEKAEVTAESDGEWYPAIVLKTEPEKCFVQYIGYDASENRWLDKNRIRFPARPGANISDLVTAARKLENHNGALAQNV